MALTQALVHQLAVMTAEDTFHLTLKLQVQYDHTCVRKQVFVAEMNFLLSFRTLVTKVMKVFLISNHFMREVR